VYLIDLNRNAFEVEQNGKSIRFLSFFNASIPIGSLAKRSPRSTSIMPDPLRSTPILLFKTDYKTNLGNLEAWNGEPSIYFIAKLDLEFMPLIR